MFTDNCRKINEVTASKVEEIKYDPSRFEFGDVPHDPETTKNLGYAGFRVLYPINKADKQDDLLVQEFSSLQAVDNEHVAAIPLAEKEVKYRYFQSWIQQTLDTIASVDADKFSGGNAYLLLALIFRIDFLIAPEGKLLSDLEKINGIWTIKETLNEWNT